MVRIEELIEERKKYPLFNREATLYEPTLDIVLNSPQQKTVYLLTTNFFFCRWDQRVLQDRYYVSGVYKLGYMPEFKPCQMYIVQLSSKLTAGMKVALPSGELLIWQKEAKSDKCTEEDWINYSRLLEDWINGGEQPESSDLWEFNYIRKDVLARNDIRPEVYTEEFLSIKKAFLQSNVKPLSDYAELFCVKKDRSADAKSGQSLDIKLAEYPLKSSCFIDGRSSNFVLENGDIIIKQRTWHDYTWNIEIDETKIFLFYYDETPIYAPAGTLVIRCKSIIPERLFFYLRLVSTQKYLASTKTLFVGQMRTYKDLPLISSVLSINALNNLPVLSLSFSNEKYVENFNLIRHFGSQTFEYIQEKPYKKKKKKLSKTISNGAPANDVTAEIEKMFELLKNDSLKAVLKEDINDLERCFRYGLYKATAALAGSILEGVLKEWFEDLKITETYKEKGVPIPDNLDGYISAIRTEQPSGEDISRKATFIRVMRNRIHIDRALREGPVDEQSCRTIISYLYDILKAKGITVETEEK